MQPQNSRAGTTPQLAEYRTRTRLSLRPIVIATLIGGLAWAAPGAAQDAGADSPPTEKRPARGPTADTRATDRTTAAPFAGSAATSKAPRPPGAEPRERARALFEQAMRAYDESDYRKALALLKAARAHYPSRLFLFNIAQTRRKLGQCAAAREDYLRYLDAETDPERRGLAEVGLDRLRGCRDRGMERRMPEDGAGDAPMAAGRRTEEAPVWIAWTTTGALGAAWITAASMALATKLEVESARTGAVSPARRDTLQQRGESWGLAADLLGLTTLVGIGVSITWTLTSDLQPDDERGTSSRARAAIGIKPGGVVLSGAF